MFLHFLLLIPRLCVIVGVCCITFSLMKNIAGSNYNSNKFKINGLSLIHASIQTVTIIPIFLSYPVWSMTWEQIVSFHNFYTLSVIAHLNFIYYIYLEILYLFPHLKPLDIFHHLVNFIAILLSLIINISYFSICGIMFEVSTVFLHARKFIGDQNRIYADILFAATFCFTRIFVGGWLTIATFINMGIFSATFIFLCMNLILNTYWFTQIFQTFNTKYLKSQK